jgi:hypothetical protein
MTTRLEMNISTGAVCYSRQFIKNANLPFQRRLIFLIISLIYGFTLSQIPTKEFSDFSNYLVYAEYSMETLFIRAGAGVLSVLANEPLWLIGNGFLSLFLQPEAVVRIIIFLSAFSVAFITLSSKPKNTIWLLLILISPVIIKNHLVHIRQGTAIAVFLAGWFLANNYWRYFFIGLTPFIHSSFFIVIFILLLSMFMLKIRLRSGLSSIIFFLVGASIGITLISIASFLGARQGVDNQFLKNGTSGLGFIFWLFIGVVMYSRKNFFLRDHVFEIGCILIYLGAYFFTELTARVFESAILLVLLAGLELKNWRLSVFQASISSYVMLIWLFKVGTPAFGFSAA